MKVLAVGASGSSAGLVTRALRRRGVEVRGMVHSPDKSDQARSNGASEVVVADLENRQALKDAVAGVDGVFHVIPAFSSDEAGAGVKLVDVAAEVGVDRFVFSSVYHPSLTALSNHRDKQPAEQALFESDLPFVILQPAMFMAQLDGLVDQARRSGAITGPYSADAAMAYVDYRDVAEVAAEAFVSDRLVNGTFELSGPGTYTRRDLASVLSELLGQPVRAEASDPEPPGQASPSMREGLQRMFDHYDRYGFHGGNDLVLSTLLGRRATDVSSYLRAVVARAGGS